MKKAFINSLHNIMEQDEKVFLLVGDLGFGVVTPIAEKYPEKLINVGICEQNMAAVAAGMAMAGNTVFIYSIGNFPTLRCIEQIRNDVAYNNAHVVVVSVGGGFAYGNLGMSHHATEDLSIMRAIPEISVLAPADPYETEKAVEYAYKAEQTVYLRLGRGKEPNLAHKDASWEITSPRNLVMGKRILILSCGIITAEAVIAAKKINDRKPECCAVYSVPLIKPGYEEIIELAKQYDVIVTVEENTRVGGFGSSVLELLSDAGIQAKVKRIGLEDSFTREVGSPEHLREYCGIDSQGILRVMEGLL